MFSSATIDARGVWKPSDGRAAAPDLPRREHAAVAGQPARLQPGVHGSAAELGDHDVRRLLDDQLGAARPRIASAIWFAIVAVGR